MHYKYKLYAKKNDITIAYMIKNFINFSNSRNKSLSFFSVNKNILFKIFIIIIFTPILLKGQVKQLNNNKINCDSLNNDYGESGLIVEKLPSLKLSIAEIQNDFLKLIDTTNFRKTIYIKLFVDTLGNVNCPIIIKGNINGKLDSIALNFVSQLKFIPGERAKKKFGMFAIVPFYDNEVNETSEMIRKNGIWYEKVKK